MGDCLVITDVIRGDLVLKKDRGAKGILKTLPCLGNLTGDP